MNRLLPRLAFLSLLLLGMPLTAFATEPVLLGVDALARDGFTVLAYQRVGLITNHTGVNGQNRPTIDVLHNAEELSLVRLFGPEHGIRGEFDQAMIEDGTDGPTGLPITSLYGPRRKPTPEQLEGIDTLVFDIQDIGCRFYTYISTMKLAMEAASEAGIRFVVLDRPNPIDGVTIEGPLLDGEESFVGCHSLPLRHGMTIGEIARLFAKEGPDGKPLNIDLTVVPCEGWRRTSLWDATGLLWIDPSPNMRRLNQAVLYPGVGLLEVTNLSVGRGTDTPFELIGAPWINPWQLAAEMNSRGLPGVSFVPRFFTPESSQFAGEKCGGIDLVVTDRKKIEPVRIGMHLAHALRQLYPEAWEIDRYPRLLINKQVQAALVAGENPERLTELTKEGLDAFRARRATVLLY